MTRFSRRLTLLLPAQNANEEIRAVVILSRHGVRAPLDSETRGDQYNAQPWPAWPVETGVLTEHGREALHLLAAYYRTRYPDIFANGKCDRQTLYFEANNAQRTIASAKAFLEGLGPDCGTEVHSQPAGRANPLFSSPTVNDQTVAKALANQILGRLGGRLDWWTNAFAEPLEEMRHVLLDCGGADCDHSKKSLLTAPAVVEPSRGGVRVDGPAAMGADFAEHFLLQYTEGFPMEKVGWGRVSRPVLNRLMEMNTRYHEFVSRTSSSAQVAASDLGFRIEATLQQAARGETAPGALGTAQSRFIMLAGHDGTISGLAGLLRMDWLLPDETFNATPPGGAMVFELYRQKGQQDFRVRAFFIAQTLDQIRFLRPLTGPEQAAVAPVFIPGCSGAERDYACSIQGFSHAVEAAIDKGFLEAALRP
jgi:4-phytase/acid phosphatase